MTKMMVLHNINEEDSDLEKGSDDEHNQTFNVGLKIKPLEELNLKDSRSINVVENGEVNSSNTARHQRMNSLDLTKLDNQKLKQLIHSQNKLEIKQSALAPIREVKPRHTERVTVNLDDLRNEVQEGTFNTPRFDTDENNKPDSSGKVHFNGQKRNLNEYITNIRNDINTIGNSMNLDESALIEYSMEMQSKFKGLLNDANESTILNESLNTSKVVGHRRQYSGDTSVLFGKEYINDTINQSMAVAQNNERDSELSRILNLDGLFNDKTESRANFDFKEQEKEFQKMLENLDSDEDDQEPEIVNTQKKNNNVFGFGNDSTPENSDHSGSRPGTPELNKEAFNPFKSPVVPEVIGKNGQRGKMNRSDDNSKSEDNKSESGEIKIVPEQNSEQRYDYIIDIMIFIFIKFIKTYLITIQIYHHLKFYLK